MREPGSITDSTYEYEHSYLRKTVRLGVTCSGIAREPCICWQVGERSGERGYIRLDSSESVLHLEEDETARLDGQLVSEIPVPRETGKELKHAVEKLGSVVSDSNRITVDPSAFPPEVGEFERLGWEAERNVMWYWRDERSPPRAYQIERGELVFRAQEWADESCLKKELVQRHDLKCYRKDN